MFKGGILGLVNSVKEHTFVGKMGEGVKIEVARGAVSKVLEKGEKAIQDEGK